MDFQSGPSMAALISRGHVRLATGARSPGDARCRPCEGVIHETAGSVPALAAEAK